MSCAICTGALTEEPDDLLDGGVNAGTSGPSTHKKRKSSGTSGGGGSWFDGPSTSRGGGGSEEETAGLCATSCGHVYHRGCIEKWLKGSSKKCPLCQDRLWKRGLKTVYLAGDGLERSERKLKKEVEEKSNQLVEAKKGQREMSQRIDELFEENEEVKMKNRDLEDKVEILEEMWGNLKKKDGGWVCAGWGEVEMARELQVEKKKREMDQTIRVLGEKIREMEVKNWVLEEKVKDLEKNKEEEEKYRAFERKMDRLEEERREQDEKMRESERTREFEGKMREFVEKNKTLIEDLDATKLKCVAAELKYLNLRGQVARMVKISGALNVELQLLGKEIDGGAGASGRDGV